MYKITPLNSISENGLQKLPAPDFSIGKDCTEPDAVILRSFDMHSMALPESLLAIARAGAGVNNIPIDDCSQKGIVVFNTPGANANAVKELVIAGMMLSSRKISDGIAWAKTLTGQPDIAALVEKGKSKFVGPELYGKKLGVIGLGAIGALVANAGIGLGMDVMGHDPFLSVDAAWSLSRAVMKAPSVEALVAECDYISLHVPCNERTKGMYGKELFSITKPGARLMNFARAELVDTAALKDALSSGILSCYVTDFPNADVLETENTICIPHLGASTPESEEHCAEMAANELKNYLLYGIIRNSVNFPTCEVPYSGKVRIAVTHRNIPNTVSPILAVFAREGLNIDNMSNQSKKDWAYTLIDLDGELGGKGAGLLSEVMKVEGVVGARIVREK